jgi:hypothetical protein
MWWEAHFWFRRIGWRDGIRIVKNPKYGWERKSGDYRSNLKGFSFVAM